MEQFFQKDEILIKPPKDLEALLSLKTGIVFFKDISKLLRIDSAVIKEEVRSIQEKDGNPWEVVGAKLIFNHWYIRLKVFIPYYNKHLRPRPKVDPTWDANTLLHQTGVFPLGEVAKLLPFTSSQIRYQAKKTKNSRRTLGVWKDKDIYVVDMAIFSKWLKKIWVNKT